MSIFVDVEKTDPELLGLPPYSMKVWPEWELKPFIELKIEKTLETGCETGWEPLFFKEWGGQ